MVNAERWAVDTSVAIAAVDGAHRAHGACRAVVRELRPALAGHAAFETFSVLTRLPGQLGIDPRDAAGLLARAFPESVWLSPAASAALLARLAPVGIVGGAVYDALVGEAARVNDCLLLTRDLRARRTYDLLGVEHRFVGVAQH